jgi:inositol oxygenase
MVTSHKINIRAALEMLDKMTDESDPDTLASQMQHALQSAEAARNNGQPSWMILVALIHDLGKMLTLYVTL